MDPTLCFRKEIHLALPKKPTRDLDVAILCLREYDQTKETGKRNAQQLLYAHKTGHLIFRRLGYNDKRALYSELFSWEGYDIQDDLPLIAKLYCGQLSHEYRM